MAKREALVMELFSRVPLTRESARTQLQALIEFDDGVFTPEKCDVYEPLRESFDPKDLTEPVRWLSQPGGEMKFRRSRPVRVEGYIQNAKFSKMWIEDDDRRMTELKPGVPEPVFCTRWVVWIDAAGARRKGTEFLKQFFIEMFRASRADYGFLTPETDRKRKNFLVLEDERFIREKFVGDDPEKGIPGLYWMNLFGPLYVEWFGRVQMNQVPAAIVEERADGSVFLQFGTTAEDTLTSEVQQQEAISILGDEAFFDIRRPNRDLVVPPF